MGFALHLNSLGFRTLIYWCIPKVCITLVSKTCISKELPKHKKEPP